MTALEIKEYIQKNGKIPYVLESIGCSNIVYHDNKDYYSCSNAVGGDCNNPAAINIRNNKYLNYRNYGNCLAQRTHLQMRQIKYTIFCLNGEFFMMKVNTENI